MKQSADDAIKMTTPARSGKCWYLIYSKPRQEKGAVENLLRQNYEVYFPQIQLWRSRRGNRQLVIEPLFPRYLFIHLDSHSDNWAPIRSTLGGPCVVRSNCRLAAKEGDRDIVVERPSNEVLRLETRPGGTYTLTK